MADFDALAIPGGFAEAGFYTDAFAPKFLDVIRHFDGKNKPIAAICVAALSLGKSGVLKNRRATTYAFPNNPRQAQLRQMGVNVQPNARIVRDGNIITSSSPETASTSLFCY